MAENIHRKIFLEEIIEIILNIQRCNNAINT